MMPISRLSAAAALVWLLAWIDATLTRQLPIWVLWGVFTAVTVGAIASTFFGKLPRRLAMSIAFVPVCHWLFFSASQLGWNAMASAAQRVGIAGMFVMVNALRQGMLFDLRMLLFGFGGFAVAGLLARHLRRSGERLVLRPDGGALVV